MIKLERVRKRFGANEVLRGVSLSLRAGCTLALLGSSGVGKSVLLTTVIGLLEPDEGEVWVGGVDLTGAPEREAARTLTGTSKELRAASVSLRSILGKIDRGHGSLGQAVNDPTLYQALLTAAGHVDEAAVGARALVRDLHARPERYIRVSLF